jgi:hypothetical protein
LCTVLGQALYLMPLRPVPNDCPKCTRRQSAQNSSVLIGRSFLRIGLSLALGHSRFWRKHKMPKCPFVIYHAGSVNYERAVGTISRVWVRSQKTLGGCPVRAATWTMKGQPWRLSQILLHSIHSAALQPETRRPCRKRGRLDWDAPFSSSHGQEGYKTGLIPVTQPGSGKLSGQGMCTELIGANSPSANSVGTSALWALWAVVRHRPEGEPTHSHRFSHVYFASSDFFSETKDGIFLQV